MDEQTSGLVESLKVGYDFGIVYIRDEDTDLKELFIIWVTIGDNFLPDSGEFGTAIVSRASGRLLQSMNLSLLRDALCKGLRVTIRHDAFGSFVHAVEVHAPMTPGSFGSEVDAPATGPVAPTP